MQLHWTPNFSVNALHAAESACLFGTKLIDPKVTEFLGSYALDLGQWIDASVAIEPRRFWHLLIGQAMGIESNWELAKSVVSQSELKPNADRNAVTQLSGHITDIEAAFKQLYPKAIEQLPLRIRPLQEQWLGYGPGILAHLKRLTDSSLVAAEARVVPVQPIQGGAGAAHIQHNMVRIEAVLTNPLVEIPEVVRLVWLLSQLQLDLPIHSETLGSQLLSRLAPLAMLAPTLAAAEVLELSKCDESVAELAIEHWHIPVPRDKDLHQEVVPTLMDWWETYLQTRPEWHLAMQALGKMLGVSSIYA